MENGEERQEVEKISAQGGQHNLGALLQEFGRTKIALENELAKVVVGQKDAIRQIFAAIFTRGHCLLEGVPGLAKTLTVQTIAKILDVKFRRIQFTPDLTPTDVTGAEVLEEDAQGKRSFRFVEGPVFTNILLADEINRTPPKTQSHRKGVYSAKERMFSQTCRASSRVGTMTSALMRRSPAAAPSCSRCRMGAP